LRRFEVSSAARFAAGDTMNVRRAITIALAFIALSVTVLWLLPSASKEHLHVSRQIPLSQHLVSPYTIVSTPDGGYIVTGSDNISDVYGWATRLNSKGQPLWEFLDGPPDGWNKLTPPSINRVNGAVLLPDDRTLLCGVKDRGRDNNPGHLVIIDLQGTVSAQKELFPGGDEVNYSAEFTKCLPWGNGIAVLGFASGNGRSSGWLLKLDLTGAVLWEKLIPIGHAQDAIETANHELLVLSTAEHDVRNSRIDRLDGTGAILLTRKLLGRGRFVRAPTATHSIGVTLEQVPDGPTQLVFLDDSFTSSGTPIDLGRVSPRSSYQLADRRTVVFGSSFNGGWAAAVQIIHGHTASPPLTLDPSYGSDAIEDAVPTTRPNEFATVRKIIGEKRAFLEWISIEK
jgi:hypothetical protein